MNVKEYIKDRILAITLILLLVFFIETFLILFSCNLFLLLMIPLAICFVSLLILGIEYYNKKQFYDKLEHVILHLDQKYLFHELVSSPSFIEGQKLISFFEDVNKKMIEDVNFYKQLQAEYREYIELWVHEIKTPIASSKLIMENNPSQVTKSLGEELKKIDDFVEQALYYSRSNNVEKDYLIKKVNIESCVNAVIVKNKRDFISKKIRLELKDLNQIVYTDSKWLEYMLHQIISNSVKYMKAKEPSIIISTKTFKNRLELYIEDNGIGIEKSDLPKVFEKSFTGNNGRLYHQSTGMGLYLCKKLCQKLGLQIKIDSQKDVFTRVTLIFPIDSRLTMQ